MLVRFLLGLAAVAGLALVSLQVTLQAAAPEAGKPALGAFGLDTGGMDRSVRPGDDFYRFVNGTWQDQTRIPDDRSSWGGFAALRDLSDQRTRELVEAVAAAKPPAGSVAQKVGERRRL